MDRRLGGVERAVIVGGGYIGLEAAAVAAKLGLQVTVLEMAPRILQRVASPETSAYFRALHHAHGVDILESTGLDRLLGTGHVAGVRLQDGRELPADFVIAGVGILPGTVLAEAAGITLDNGIATDAYGQTSAPHVWSAGDCASFPWQGGRIRLESVGNAIDQAEAVAVELEALCLTLLRAHPTAIQIAFVPAVMPRGAALLLEMLSTPARTVKSPTV